MKRIIYVVVLLFLFIVLLLVGHREMNKQVISSCSMIDSQPNSGYEMNTKYEIYSTSNIVDKVILKQEITVNNGQSVDEFKKNIEETYKKNNSRYGGYSINVKTKSNKIFAEGTIDFKKMNLDKFIKDNIAFKDYVDKKGRVTLNGIKKMYLSNGAICQ